MCGIAGINSVRQSNGRQNSKDIKSMMLAMRSRGPDAQGVWSSDALNVHLCHTRLSIIDVSKNANQPMIDSNSKLVIIYNGELYNYKELQLHLLMKGYSFKTNSDTEVILKMFQEYGDKMLNKLRGMFALSIYNKDTETLFLARDYYGIKPLYYFDNGNIFAFASQVKALEKCSFVSSDISSAALVSFLCNGSVAEPFTIKKDIKPLEPGSFMTVDKNGKVLKFKYYSFLEHILNIEGSENLIPIDINKAMVDTVAAHSVSDVHMTTFLSSGVDSISILDKIDSAYNPNMSTTTLGFYDYKSTVYDETVLAKNVSDNYNFKNNSKWVTKEEFLLLKKKILKSMDQPTIDGINTYLLCNYLKDLNIKVGLSGVGADELFSGYPTFNDVPKIARLPQFTNTLILDSLSRLALYTSKLIKKPKAAFLPKYCGSYNKAYFYRRSLFIPEQLKGALPENVYNEGVDVFQELMFNERDVALINNKHLKITYLEFEFYLKNQLLRDADWAGMANSVEIRTPYIDKVFIDNVIKEVVRSTSITKGDLLSTIRNPLVRKKLEGRSKTGFMIPVSKWINSNSNSYHGWALEISKQYI